MDRFKSIDRRAFLRLSGCAGIAGALPLVSPAIGLASLPGSNRGLQAAQQTRPLMGTVVSITVVDSSADRAQKAVDAGFARMEQLIPSFDRHSGSGPIMELNSTGRLSGLTPELRRVLDLSAQAERVTGGAFDITVAPVLDAFKKSFASGKKPSADEIRNLLAAIGGLRREADGLRLTKAGAAVTLDGVAKGFIADQAMAAIAGAGATRALINAGGDVVVMGDSGKRPWRVGIADPANPKAAKIVLQMTSGAVATSGNYEVYYDRERLYHHIVNPATGLSPRMDLSASVRASSAATADAMSTACFVMKPNMAMRMIKAQPNIEALIITKHGQRHQSAGFVF